MYPNQIHTDHQRKQIEGWLATRWGIRNKLDPNHPFYTTPFGVHEFYPNAFPSTNYTDLIV
jgi:hypothetical protein